MSDCVQHTDSVRHPDSVGFWRRMWLKADAESPRWTYPPDDPEELERWNEEDARRQAEQAQEDAVRARYRRMFNREPLKA